MKKTFIVGDSVSAASRAPSVWATGQAWGELIANALGSTAINLCIPGYTTAQMSSQWDAVMAQYGAGDDVLCKPGENDINVTPIATFRSTLDGQLAAAIASGIPANKITLVTPFLVKTTAYLQAAPAYLQAMREVAYARGVPLIDSFDYVCELMQTTDSTGLWASGDNGHPSVAGQLALYRQFTLPQNAFSSVYHAYVAPPVPPTPTGPPSITLTSLHQTAGAGPTMLSDRVTYSDPVGVPAVSYNVQDYNNGGEAAFLLNGSPFAANGASTLVTAAQFAQIQIAPVTHAHDIWVNANNGSYNSGGKNFGVTPP